MFLFIGTFNVGLEFKAKIVDFKASPVDVFVVTKFCYVMTIVLPSVFHFVAIMISMSRYSSKVSSKIPLIVCRNIVLSVTT